MQLDGILLIAIKTGWPPDAIRALPLTEFNHYLNRLTESADDRE